MAALAAQVGPAAQVGSAVQGVRLVWPSQWREVAWVASEVVVVVLQSVGLEVRVVHPISS